ncbi:hypothetical protein ACJX0J_024071, partial [Zea mays]
YIHCRQFPNTKNYYYILHDKDAALQVQVNRKWEFRGIKDDGPILHIDMVLTDAMGNSIYAEIPSDIVDEQNPLINVNKVYIIRRFRVIYAKSSYKVVDAPFMICFTKFTIIELCREPPTTFPQYVYRLTPYNEIDPFGPKAKTFHDVIGLIKEVTKINPIYSGPTQSTSKIRNVFITDLSDNIMKITLWGNRAEQFSYNSVYDPQRKNPIVVLFVGCLPKEYQGDIVLNGGAACHTMTEMVLQLPLLTKDDIVPFDKEGCECTVTIVRISEKNKWWYPACTKCPKKPAMNRKTMQCRECGSIDYCFRYRLSFIASDGTAEANMFCFENVATKIVGKSSASLLASAADPEITPPDIAAIVSLKFTFVVTYDNESYGGHSKIFLIRSILATYGRDSLLPQIQENVDITYPNTPMQLTAKEHKSPSTAMSNLTTNSPPH